MLLIIIIMIMKYTYKGVAGNRSRTSNDIQVNIRRVKNNNTGRVNKKSEKFLCRIQPQEFSSKSMVQ